MDEADLQPLLDEIRARHGCEATWVESVAVRASIHDLALATNSDLRERWRSDPSAGASSERTFGVMPAWHGEVQVFDLTGHPEATRAYAWSSRMMHVRGERDVQHQQWEALRDSPPRMPRWFSLIARAAMFLQPATPTGHRKLYAVLHVPPADSPLAAVCVTMMKEARGAAR